MIGREAVSALALLSLLFCGTPGARAEEQATEETPFPSGMTSVGLDLQEAAEAEGDLGLDDLIPAAADTPTLDLNADYAVLFQEADASLSGESSALGGVFRVYGRWIVSGRGTNDTGSIVGKIEHRHGIGSYLAPADLTQQLGDLGITGTGFTDVGLFLGPLFWKQYFNDAHAVVVVGRLNPPSAQAMDVVARITARS